MSDSIKQLTAEVTAFCKAREWDNRQLPKDLAISIVLEASELLEHFQWIPDGKLSEQVLSHKEEISDEMADVMIYLLEMAQSVDIDLAEAVRSKLIKAAIKYPPKMSK